MICIQCDKNKTLSRFDPYEGNKKDPICIQCLETVSVTEPSYNRGDTIEATCMKCREKYSSNYKWGFCPACKGSVDRVEINTENNYCYM